MHPLARATSLSLIRAPRVRPLDLVALAPILTLPVRAWTVGRGLGFSSSATWWLICCHQRLREPRTLGGREVMRGGRPGAQSFLLETQATQQSPGIEKKLRTPGLINLALNSSSVYVTPGKSFPYLSETVSVSVKWE